MKAYQVQEIQLAGQNQDMNRMMCCCMSENTAYLCTHVISGS